MGDDMQIEAQLADERILEILGQRLARRRVDLQLTQAQLAEQAGLSKRTVERMEAGATTQLSSLVRVLRVLGWTERLEQLAPQPEPRPMELLRLKGKQRQRASGQVREPAANWQWGDDD